MTYKIQALIECPACKVKAMEFVVRELLSIMFFVKGVVVEPHKKTKTKKEPKQ